MATSALNSAPRRLLEGWKEIATHLRVQVRTAQRWEKSLGLPVRRITGQKKSRVVADPAELDAWLAGADRRGLVEAAETRTQYPRWLLWGAVVLGAAIAGVFLFRFLRYVPPDSYSVHGTTLAVHDADGDDLWRYRFPTPFDVMSYADPGVRGRFEDLDGDQKAEFLFEYRCSTYRQTGTTLYCFSHRGKLKWTFKPKAGVVGRSGREIPSRYTVEQFLPVKRAGKVAYVAVTSAHLWSFPGLLNVLDTDGKIRGEYWHAGHVRSLGASDLDGDGNEEILAAGVNNGYRMATLLVFDADRVGGLSAFPEGDQHRIFGRGPGTERAIVRFPRPCFTEKYDRYNWVSNLVVSPKGIELYVNEGTEVGAPTATYELDRHLNVTGMALSGAFQSRHRDLESRHLLDHTITKEEHDSLKKVTVIRR